MITGSGQISMSDINTEFGLSATLANSSLTNASTGGGSYPAINTSSPSYPNGVVPHAMSEFYSYDHDYATSTTTTSTTSTTTTSTTSTTLPPCTFRGTWDIGSTALQACQGLSGTTSVYSRYALDIGVSVYSNSGCSTALGNGYYSDSIEYFQVSSGQIVATGFCDDVTTTTTTTSTTTTTAAPCHEQNLGYSTVSRADACNEFSLGGDFFYSNCAVIDTGCFLYTDMNCTTDSTETGYYSSGSYSWTYSQTLGLQNKEACPATTTTTTAAPTTTTTTTAAPSGCEPHDLGYHASSDSTACLAIPSTYYSDYATLQVGATFTLETIVRRQYQQDTTQMDGKCGQSMRVV
jgi:hypothetical protein